MCSITNNDKLEKIELIKFLNGQASEEEAKRVMDWLGQENSKKELEDMINEDWKNSGNVDSPEAYRRILDQIHEKIIPGSKSKGIGKNLVFLAKIAASFLLLVSAAYLVFNQEAEKPVLADVPVKIFNRKAGVGEKLRITLPDETAVILNSLSELSFTADFGKRDRKVTLTGEAYFEIMPDPTRPFQVETERVITKALGTAFNVLSRNENTEIALIEGKVSVKKASGDPSDELLLSPGEMAFVYNDRENIAVKKFDPQSVIAWKEGKIRFKSKPIQTILDDLQTWYAVSVEYRGNVNMNRNVTGVFDNESLKNILEGLSFSMGINYELKGNQVIIKP